MNRRPLIAVAVTVVVAVLAATLVRAAGPDQSASSTTSTTAATADRPSAGDDLVALLTRARDLTYNAAYSVKSSDPEVAGGNLTVEVWRSPPRVRQDSDNQVDGRQARTAAIKDGKIIRCEQPAGGAWKCAPAPASEAGDFDNLVDRVAAEVKISTVTETEATVNGRKARCFDLSSKRGDVTQVCVDADGVPVRVASADATLEITRLSRSVNARVFDPPAPVASS